MFLPPPGVLAFAVAAGAPWAMPLYRYFMSVSQTSEPPSDWYIRCRRGVISDCRMFCRISVTVARCMACRAVLSRNFEKILRGLCRSDCLNFKKYPPSLARPRRTAHFRALLLMPLHCRPLLIAVVFVRRVSARLKSRQVERQASALKDRNCRQTPGRVHLR